METSIERTDLLDELVRAFSFPQTDLSEVIPWTSGFGLSRIRRYGDGYATLYRIWISEEELESPDSTKNLSASAFYGKDTQNGISIRENGNLSDPIDLNFPNEFFYNTSSKEFFRKRKLTTAPQIIDVIEDAHTRPQKKVKGFLLRTRLRFWRRFLPESIRYFDIIAAILLRIISGEKVKEDIWKRLIDKRYAKEDAARAPAQDIEFEKAEMMEFFGYHAKRWSVIFYSALHLFIILILFYTHASIELPKTVFPEEFIALCYVVVTFWFTEFLIPHLLKGIIKGVNPTIFNRILSKRLKV